MKDEIHYLTSSKNLLEAENTSLKAEVERLEVASHKSIPMKDKISGLTLSRNLLEVPKEGLQAEVDRLKESKISKEAPQELPRGSNPEHSRTSIPSASAEGLKLAQSFKVKIPIESTQDVAHGNATKSVGDVAPSQSSKRPHDADDSGYANTFKKFARSSVDKDRPEPVQPKLGNMQQTPTVPGKDKIGEQT